MNRITEPAKITQMDIGLEDHGSTFMWADFNYGGSGQGFGFLGIDMEFIVGMLEACNVDRLSQCVGKVVMIDHDNGKIYSVLPMKFSGGKPFDCEAWSLKQREEEVHSFR